MFDVTYVKLENAFKSSGPKSCYEASPRLKFLYTTMPLRNKMRLVCGKNNLLFIQSFTILDVENSYRNTTMVLCTMEGSRVICMRFRSVCTHCIFTSGARDISMDFS